MKSLLKNILLCSLLFTIKAMTCLGQTRIYVSPTGNNMQKGELSSPLKTLTEAITRANSLKNQNVIIELRGGIYQMETSIQINSENSFYRSLIIQSYKNEKAILNGAKNISPVWQTYRGNILRASIDLGKSPDRLFMNGKPLHMARYPNYDSTARNFNGTASDAISEERIKHWKNPAGGYIHALHQGEWGGLHFRITGKKTNGELEYEGGWQNNRPAPMHTKHRFVENIFEELDAPGEWFYDSAAKKLYLYPPDGKLPANATFAVSLISDLIHLKGITSQPVKNVTIRGIHFTQTERTFMLTREPLLRSDWTIYRGGAILLDGTENCTISECDFSNIGGNAIFLSNYNKGAICKSNHIRNAGGSGIALVGDASAVRSPSFRYEQFVDFEKMDFTKGPKGNNYPQNCNIENNLIHDIGRIEKQVAAVEIDIAAHITVSYNSIYNVPRSGINIGDGCWGGHVIEYNDVFNTVLETGDHGAFNSWGRDRFWRPERNIIDSIVAARPGIQFLDVIDPIIIRNNRFRCDHGWDIDLDDGSSNYQIYNNVCLSGGLKLREGYKRVVTNNILVNNTFHPHVWLKNSDDVFTKNIVTLPYAPILIDHWGKRVDSNFFLQQQDLLAAQQLGIDANSKYGNAGFINAAAGDYRVTSSSQALQTGFRSFEMNFGVQFPSLKKIALKPKINALITGGANAKGETFEWLGALFKNIETLGEQSAAGLPDKNGALLSDLPANSVAAKSHLQKGDVIISLAKKEVLSTSDLLRIYAGIKWTGSAECVIIRNQQKKTISVSFN